MFVDIFSHLNKIALLNKINKFINFIYKEVKNSIFYQIIKNIKFNP